MRRVSELSRRLARVVLRTALGSRSWQRLGEAIRIRRLRRLVRRLKQNGTRGQVNQELLDEIRCAWGNQGWSADVGFLAQVANRAVVGIGPFLECGSGLTTVIAGALAGSRGIRVVSLEQDEEWSRKLATLLAALEIEGVTLWHTPLIARDDIVWFDLLGRELPTAFSTVFCDGPSVGRSRWTEEQTLNWRSGVVSVLKRLGIEFGEILLDDMDDPRAEHLVARWEAEGLRTRVVATPTGPLLIATSIGSS